MRNRWQSQGKAPQRLPLSGACRPLKLAHETVLATVLPGRRLALVVVILAVAIDAFRLAGWATHRKYVIEETKRALPALITPGSPTWPPDSA